MGKIPGVFAPRTPSAKNQEIVRGLIAENLESVNRLPRPVLAKLVPALSQAQHEVERELRAWLAKQAGDSRFTAQVLRNALVNIRTSMKHIKGLQPTLMDGLRIGSQRAGLLATGTLEKDLARFANIFEGTVKPITLDVAAIIARSDRELQPRFLETSIEYPKTISEDIRKALMVGRIRGETMNELTNRLNHELPVRFAKHRYFAERIARTETMHAYNTYHYEGIRDAHREDRGVQMRWDASYDRRRCAYCASLDGKIVDVGDSFEAEWTSTLSTGGNASFKRTSERPPAHPNCRCVLVPWHEDWADVPGRDWAPPIPGSKEAASLAKSQTSRDVRNAGVSKH